MSVGPVPKCAAVYLAICTGRPHNNVRRKKLPRADDICGEGDVLYSRSDKRVYYHSTYIRAAVMYCGITLVESSKRRRWRPDSDVAVDDADYDDDRHASDDGRGEDQPTVLERTRHDVAQEDRSGVNRVVRVAWTRPGRRTSARSLPRDRRRRSDRLYAAASGRQRSPLGTNAAITNVRRSTSVIQPTCTRRIH